MGKATEFKFGRYIHRVHPNKSPLKISEKRERGHIQGLPKLLKYPLLSQEWGKATNFKFCTHFHSIDYNKSSLTISGKVAAGVARDSRNFCRASIYRAHRAVILAIARLSCLYTAVLYKLAMSSTRETVLYGTTFQPFRSGPRPDLISLLILFFLLLLERPLQTLILRTTLWS